MKYNFESSGYSREQKVAGIYKTATGSNAQIFDSNCQPLPMDGDSNIEQSICKYCTQCNICNDIHARAIQESCNRGRTCIYQCELGLLFWAAPVFREGKFSGALRGSGYINGSADKALIAKKCNGKIPVKEFSRRVAAFPAGDMEKIKSLAEMLLLCTESVSTGKENYHELLRIRCGQKASLSALIEELKQKHPEGSAPPGYPLDKERRLVSSLNRGKREEAEGYLNEILAILVFNNPNQFRYIQLRSLELAVMIVRTDVNPGNGAAEKKARYLKQIQEAKTVEELTGILHNLIEIISGEITSFQGIPHALAMRKAEAFIRENFTRKISLHEISKVAGLSAPYFSTIFKEEMGENLSRYINRLRVEKASKMLLETDISLSEISSECCFEDQSWFSKIFKAFTGISPGKYRNQGGTTINAWSN